VVARLARLLLEYGERPAILTRGYARRSPRDGVTVVSNRSAVIAAVDASGDEPLMLARALPGVPVLAGADRFLSGRLAEEQLEATVHILDDGFQHVGLARDIDLLLADLIDLNDHVIPAGRLREPLAAASVADAVLATTQLGSGEHGAAADPASLGRALGVAVAFGVRRRIEEPSAVLRGAPVLAVAAIARPGRFFTDLSAAGWSVAGTLAFRDHHRFGARDVDRIAVQARSVGADLIVTTEKDAVRFESCDLGQLRLRAVPLTVAIEPSAAFENWLLERLRAAQVTSRAWRGHAAAGASRRRHPTPHSVGHPVTAASAGNTRSPAP
jgi:tetraacyldisaccharide 4'-kinase